MVKVKTSVVNNEAKTEAAGTTVKRKIPSNKLKKVWNLSVSVALPT